MVYKPSIGGCALSDVQLWLTGGGERMSSSGRWRQNRQGRRYLIHLFTTRVNEPLDRADHKFIHFVEELAGLSYSDSQHTFEVVIIWEHRECGNGL